MKKNRNKATLMLFASVSLFLVSLPYVHTFLGGLLYSACAAALVGGIADWFAVSALFRRPLGIGFRTEIIPRNRDRIFHELIDMVENTLLTKEHLKAHIAKQDLARIIADYLEDSQGKKLRYRLCHQLISMGINRFKPAETARFAEKLIRGQLQVIPAAPVFAGFLQWTVTEGHDRKAFLFLLQEFTRLCGASQLKVMLNEIVDKAKASYSEGRSGRKFVLDLLESGELSTEEISGKIQQELIAFSEQMQLPNAEFWSISRLWLEQWIHRLTTDQKTQEQAETIKAFLIDCIPIRQLLQTLFEQELDKLQQNDERIERLQREMDEKLDQFIEQFQQNEDQREQVNRRIKIMVDSLIDRYHFQLGKLARKNLEQYTNQKLVGFIESKVGDDLQMIRINGSLVGGLVGILLYFINFALYR